MSSEIRAGVRVVIVECGLLFIFVDLRQNGELWVPFVRPARERCELQRDAARAQDNKDRMPMIAES